MLIDKLKRPVRDLRISVTDRCNFRCGYCMPADVFGHDYVFLKKTEILTFEEIARVARLFTTLGVNKVRLTGGEPLLRKDLHALIEMLDRIEGIQDIALTTNGHFLASHAKTLKSAGVQRITISLDTLKPETHRQMAGKSVDLTRVLQGIEQAKQVGFRPIKINTVVQKDVNHTEVLDLLRFAKSQGHIIRFIEYMDVGNLNQWQLEHVVTAQEILEMIAQEFDIEPLAKNYPGEVANRYRFADGSGEFGLIASVSQPFCGGCTRARLSADGKLFTCLFSSNGIDLKKILRSGATDAEFVSIISDIWRNREDRYSEERGSTMTPSATQKVEMYQIGG